MKSKLNLSNIMQVKKIYGFYCLFYCLYWILEQFTRATLKTFFKNGKEKFKNKIKIGWVQKTLATVMIKTPKPLLLCVCWVTSVVSDSLQSCGLWLTRLLCLWDSPGKNTGVGCHALLQGIFLGQGLNPCLTSPALAVRFFTTSTSWEALLLCEIH